jgi:hypothetical protein
LFPRGPVTPQPTRWPASSVSWTPAETARQMRAYAAALAICQRPPTRRYCGLRKIGLFGSFHASQ